MPVPDYLQRACRLTFAVTLVVICGTSALFIVGPNTPDLNMQAKLATAGAGIACAVGQAPTIGSLARGGFENALGTVLGASTAVLMFFVSHVFAVNLPIMHDHYLDEYLVRVMAAPIVGGLGSLFGSKVGLDISGKMVLLTYLLTSFTNTTEQHAVLYAIGRTLAILTGVLCMNVAQVLIFPNSASNNSVRGLQRAMAMLAQLNQEVWSAFWDLNTSDSDTISVSSYALNLGSEGGDEISMAKDKLDTSNLIGDINMTLNVTETNMAAAPYELFIFRYRSFFCYVPGVHCLHLGVWKLPVEQMRPVIKAMRASSRLLYTVNRLLRSSSLWSLLRHNPVARKLIQELASASQQALNDFADSYPSYSDIPADGVQRFVKALAALREIPPPAQAWDQDVSQPSHEQVAWFAFQFAMDEVSVALQVLQLRLLGLAGRLMTVERPPPPDTVQVACACCGADLVVQVPPGGANGEHEHQHHHHHHKLSSTLAPTPMTPVFPMSFPPHFRESGTESGLTTPLLSNGIPTPSLPRTPAHSLPVSTGGRVDSPSVQR